MNSRERGRVDYSIRMFFIDHAHDDHVPQREIFFHLVDAGGQIVVQRDAAPGQWGKEPTTGWLPNEVVTHPVELLLPPELSPGQYTMHLGMYFPPDGPRLPVLGENGQSMSDFVVVGTVEVRSE